ncbi:MAG: ArgE/DapE family deacylase [Haloferacaceae archaeon]
MTTSDDEMRETVETFLSYRSLPGAEEPAQRWLLDELSDRGFETYEWQPDRDVLAAHPSFPPLETLELDDRPSVAGVLELGDPDDGPTVVLNGHADVVPVEEASWSRDAFDPWWDGDRLYGRGALDMKSGLVACVFAALSVAERTDDLDGRIVVESVVGEEEGGVGAASAAGANPYPFDRDAAIIAEPTGLDLVVASEGSLMKRLTLYGRSAHAANRWEGESVLPHFERVRQAFRSLERERAERVRHPLYEAYDNPWPVNFGTVNAGSWHSSVPAELTSELRIGVAPQETVREVEAQFEARLADVVAADDWLSAHPPDFERFSVQFEGSEVDRSEPIVEAVAGAVRERGTSPTYEGLTGGTDARHYLEAGIPTVVFGPGSSGTAHQPDEYVTWSEVVEGKRLLADAVAGLLGGD